MHCLGLTDTFRWITGFPLTPHLSDLLLQLEDRKKIELRTKDSDCQLCLRFGGFIWEWNFHCDSMLIFCLYVCKYSPHLAQSLSPIIKFRSSFRTLLHVSYSTTRKVTYWTVLDGQTEIIKRACIFCSVYEVRAEATVTTGRGAGG